MPSCWRTSGGNLMSWETCCWILKPMISQDVHVLVEERVQPPPSNATTAQIMKCHANHASWRLIFEIHFTGLRSGISNKVSSYGTTFQNSVIHYSSGIEGNLALPGDNTGPHSAFTINLLKDFQLHNLESKKAAYDYLAAIRRLSDNSFTADIPNPYQAFLRVVRVFDFLTLRKRSGQLHSIDSVLNHRPKGNLLVWCPACPEPGFNSDPNCRKTPHHLRHLNQSQRTLDGNFQCNQFNKNTDPDDVSLCAGKGYFPLESEYKKYLGKIPVSKEKSTCNYLKAVNKQDKSKFRNMAVTGTINCQCSHVFILSCVDLHHGERFANADMCLAMELTQHQPNEEFEFILRIELDDKMRWGIPALHVQGHQDSCTYLFGTAYMECVGHFHGESAEQYWPESNQLGPHVRQMNNGHRQDTMIKHHGDWNAKKTASIASALADEILEAKKKYLEKRNHFIGLSMSFSDRVGKWRELSRTPSKIWKEAISVYKHKTTKVPSQQAIFQKMLNDYSSFSTTMIPKSKVAQFMDEGLKIQDLQRKLRDLVHATDDHDLVARRKEITQRTSKTQTRLDKWRKIQKELMPHVGDKIAAQTLAAPPIHDEKLFLPSDFPREADRQALDLVSLAVEEARWREGQVFDLLRAIQNIVKTISTLYGRKKKNERQQKQNTRAGDNIEEAKKLRNQYMESYEITRQALIALDAGSAFPHLTEADLYMKPVVQKRRVGDSQHTDGALWRLQAVIPPEGETSQAFGSTLHNTDNPTVSGTQMDKRKSAPRQKKNSNESVTKVVDERPEGWVWQLGRLSKMSDAEMDEWSNEGDRVQWFRAEAEMQRWQEQKWRPPGPYWHSTARRKVLDTVHMRGRRLPCIASVQKGQALITAVGYGDLLAPDASVIERVQQERDQELKFVADALSVK
ncbi:hypothetical protein B0H13DRAFT_1862093 [Mycena leptocephala]|nr:hypothetical protein B0H13DRAFT_1862093 [Mycena leptocephala]